MASAGNAQLHCVKANKLKTNKRECNRLGTGGLFASQSIGFYRISLCSPYISVRDLGRLAMTSPMFGRRSDSRFGQRAGLNLVEQAIRCRCCSILKQKLETEHQATAVEGLDLYKSAWRKLFCLTEPTCKKCKGAGTTFLPKKLRKLAKTEAEKVWLIALVMCLDSCFMITLLE